MRVVIIYPLWSVTQRVSAGLDLFIIVTPATVRQVRKLQYLVTFFTIRVLTWVLLGKSLLWFCVTEMPFITFSNSNLQNKFWMTSATGFDGRSGKLTAWKFGTVSWYTHSSDCALCPLFQCKLFIYLFTYLFIYSAVILLCIILNLFSSFHTSCTLCICSTCFNIILSAPSFPKWYVPLRCSSKIIYRFLIWPLHLVCFAHLILPALRSWRL